MANKSTLKSQIASAIPDNAAEEITAASLRGAFNAVIDDYSNIVDDEKAIASAREIINEEIEPKIQAAEEAAAKANAAAKVEVVQELGTSETAVISQAAVTKALSETAVISQAAVTKALSEVSGDTFYIEENSLDLQNSGGEYSTGVFIDKSNKLITYTNGVSCKNIPIDSSWKYCVINSATFGSAFNLLIGGNSDNVIAQIPQKRGTTRIVFSDYPDAKYISITSVDRAYPLSLKVFVKSSNLLQEHVDANTEKINEIREITNDTVSVAEAVKNTVNGIIATNFTQEIVEDSYPDSETIDTTTGGTNISSTFGAVLSNTSLFNVKSVRFYSSRAMSSFYIAVGTVDFDNKTYKIDKKYDIDIAISAGENIIDLSSYEISFPPKALVAFSGATDYISGLHKTEKFIQLLEGVAVSKSSYKYGSAHDMTFKATFIGNSVITSVTIPDSSLSEILRAVTAPNILYKKTYCAIGDSFTDKIISDKLIEEEGLYKGYAKVYPYVIGNRNNMDVLNQGSSGSVLSGYILSKKYEKIPTNVDYITIWYGINDGGHNIPIGTIDDDITETQTSEKDTTTCGAFNWMFRWLLTNRPYAHIGVIITDYCPQNRREAIMACCEKWGIAYLDLYDPSVPAIRTRGTTKYTHSEDICPNGYVELCQEAKSLRNKAFSRNRTTFSDMHPSNDCHEWQSNIIEHFMRSL